MLAGQPLPLHRLPLHRRGHRGGQASTSAVTERRCGRDREGKGGARHASWMRFGIRSRRCVALLAGATGAQAADPLVVSIWGGNWKDTVERIVAKPFTAKTGIPVEFEVGGTIDRLAKARVAKGNPLVDLELHDHPRGPPLHLRRALRAARHGEASQREGGGPGGAPQRVPHRELDLRLHVVYRPGPREGRHHALVGSLEALAQGQDRACPTSTPRTSSRSPP